MMDKPKKKKSIQWKNGEKRDEATLSTAGVNEFELFQGMEKTNKRRS